MSIHKLEIFILGLEADFSLKETNKITQGRSSVPSND